MVRIVRGLVAMVGVQRAGATGPPSGGPRLWVGLDQDVVTAWAVGRDVRACSVLRKAGAGEGGTALGAKTPDQVIICFLFAAGLV